MLNSGYYKYIMQENLLIDGKYIRVCTNSKKPKEKDWYNKGQTAAQIYHGGRERLFDNLGNLTGKVSGYVVLDVDPRNGGDISLQKLEAEYGLLPNTLTCKTGGGGLHYYFQYPAEGIPTRKGFAPGLDFLSDKSFAMAPPSIHPVTGLAYEWEDKSLMSHSKCAPLPQWLKKQLMVLQVPSLNKEKQSLSLKNPSAPKWKNFIKGNVTVGERNETIVSLVGYLLSRDINPLLASRIISALNAVYVHPSLEVKEINSILKSISITELKKFIADN